MLDANSSMLKYTNDNKNVPMNSDEMYKEFSASCLFETRDVSINSFIKFSFL